MMLQHFRIILMGTFDRFYEGDIVPVEKFGEWRVTLKCNIKKCCWV